jgi:hypothetical protein
MAFLITYDELQRHTDRARARREAARRSAVTLVFLLVLSLAVMLAVGTPRL